VSDEDGDVVPAQWELDVLEEHVAAVMFDSLERYQAGCVLANAPSRRACSTASAGSKPNKTTRRSCWSRRS
jgi:hypothetical protein